jgi:hypothetical protein
MNWQPISTAPRNGESILLAESTVDHQEGRVGCGYWVRSQAPRSSDHQWGGHNHLLFKPDVWAPLPPPPLCKFEVDIPASLVIIKRKQRDGEL